MSKDVEEAGLLQVKSAAEVRRMACWEEEMEQVAHTAEAASPIYGKKLKYWQVISFNWTTVWMVAEMHLLARKKATGVVSLRRLLCCRWYKENKKCQDVCILF